MATRLKAPTATRLARPGGTRTSGAGSGIATPPTAGSAIGQRSSLAQSATRRASGHAPSPQQQAPVPAPSQPVTQLEVGDRVLVGGTKPGTVAFVGATQFAKGIWAGLVLDTPEGKNDGSVAGVSYFQCPPNHGLFSRPEKLTRVQKQPAAAKPALAQNEEGFAIGDRILVDGIKAGVVEFVGPTQFAKGMWVGIALDAPEGKNNGQVAGVQYFECAPLHGIFTRPAKLTLVERPPPQRRLPPAAMAAQRPPAAGQQNSLPGGVSVDELRAKAEDMSPGDRVIVSGVKVGTIRYLGPTDFAKGVWVGVELDAPEGKNNGSVSGRSYFECLPSHGLFAPLPKVEKLADDDLQYPPPARMSGAFSNSSLNSPARLMAAPTHSLMMQDPEPVPQSPLGSDAMGSSNSLSHIMFEKDHQIATLQSSVEQAEEEKHSLLEQVTSLQRRVDDLQFQLEEQAIISHDELEAASSQDKEELAKLRTDLQQEKEKNSSLNEQLKQQQQYILNQADSSSSASGDDERRELMKQLTAKDTEMEQVRQDCEQARQGHERSKLECEQARQECQQVKETNTSLTSQLSDTREQLTAAEKRAGSLSTKISDLENQVSLMSANSSEQTVIVQQQLQDKEKSLVESREEVERLSSTVQQLTTQLQTVKTELQSTEGAAGGIQSELEANRLKLQDALELCAQRGDLIDQRNSQLQAVDEQKRHLEQEVQTLTSEQARLEETTQQLTSERDDALARCDRLMVESSSASSEQEMLAQQRKEIMSERDQYRSDYSAAQMELERVTHERDELQRRLTEVESDLRGHSAEISLKYDNVQEQLDDAQSNVIRFREQVSQLQNQIDQQKISHEQQIELAQDTCLELRGRLNTAVEERETTMQQAQDLSDQLERANKDREQLRENLISSTDQVDDLQTQLDELMTSHQSLQQASVSESSLVQQELEQTQELLESKERELQAALEKNNELSEELFIKSSSSDTKRMEALEEEKLTLEEEKIMLEEDKVALEERIQDLNSQLSAAKAATNTGPVTVTEETTRLHETVTAKEQEVAFLNSVIVDLQAKVEALEALNGLGDQQDVLEYIDQDDDDLPPPRLFCDICDEFDLHDTDDCPLQAQSESPPSSMHHGVRGSERPYCDKCEVFGHWTEDCEYEETY